MAPYKNHSGENKLNQGKNAPYIKMTVAKKIGAKQLKIKMAPYKNDSGENKWATQCKMKNAI